MSIQQKLHLKLGQKLVMTPSLQQAIKLLPLARLELSTYLAQEMQVNPVLEEVTTTVDEEEYDAEAEIKEAEEVDQAEAENGNKGSVKDTFDYQAFLRDYFDLSHNPVRSEVTEYPSFENTLIKPTSLTDRSSRVAAGHDFSPRTDQHNRPPNHRQPG